MKISRTALISTAAIVLALGGGAIASAAIPASDGTLTACYKTPVPAHGTPLNIIDTEKGGSCPGGTTSVNWSQQGPPGPQGDPGPSTAGPAGLDTVEDVHYVPYDGTGQNTIHTSAQCPADHPYIITAGFASADVASHNAIIEASIPENGLSPQGWEIDLLQTVPGPNTIKIWTVCAK